MYSLGSIAKRLVTKTLPSWNTSLVTDMSGYDGGFQGFGAKSTFDGDIGSGTPGK